MTVFFVCGYRYGSAMVALLKTPYIAPSTAIGKLSLPNEKSCVVRNAARPNVQRSYEAVGRTQRA